MKKIVSVFVLLCLVATVTAQTYDFGGLVSADCELNISKHWSFDAGTELRFNQNLSKYDRWKLEVGADYSFWKKRIKLGINYDFLNYQDDEGIFDNRHRLSGASTFAYKLGDFRLSDRSIVQATFRDETRGDYKFNPKTYYRNRLELTWNIPHKPVKLYASEELFCRLYYPEHNIIDELRTIFGVEYSINKHNSLTFFLRSDNEVQVSNPENTLYLGVTYNFDTKLYKNDKD